MNKDDNTISNRISNQSKLLILIIAILLLVVSGFIYVSLSDNKDESSNESGQNLNKDYSNEEQVNSSEPDSQTSRRLLISFISKVVDAVNTEYNTNLMTGNATKDCYNISDIIVEGMNSYITLRDLAVSGYILIETDEQENPTFRIFASSSSGNLNGVNSSTLSLMNIVSGPTYLYESGCPV